MLPLLKRPVREDFVVIDSLFPQKNPFAFRNSEINQYIARIQNFGAYSMYPMAPEPGAPFGHSYGMTHDEFVENKKGYLKFYPDNGSKIHYVDKDKKYRFGLAYSFFLAETYVLLPFYEKHKISFTFVLYPGGLFGLDSKESDQMLGRVFASKYFRHVIVTQKITEDYLLKKHLCPEEKITYIYGGFVQFKRDEVKPKQYYKKDKPTFDICFVAAKYSERGVDKGYDLFIETAKKLCADTDDIMFHVIGGFDERDIDVSGLRNRIKFYGYKGPEFLLDFYSGMDVFLSPNRPFQLFGGNFDGFPLGIDAGYCGVALFVADELNMNQHYAEGKEIVRIPLRTQGIVTEVKKAYRNPERFYELARRGQQKTQELFDIDHQINRRIEVFSRYAKLELIPERSNQAGGSK